MLRRLTSIALRRPRVVLFTWVVIAALGIVATGALFSSLDTNLDSPSSFESEQVGHRLDQLDPHGGSVVAIVEGAQVPDATIAELEATPGVATVQHGPSADGEAIGVGVELKPNLSDGAEDDAVSAVAATLRGIDAPKVLVGGELLIDREFSDRAEKDAQRAELISLPIAIIVMAIVFGGIVAASLPLALAFGGVFATMIALGAVASVTDVSLYALNVVMMLGIGLGIDYGLLMVSRFREERGAGFDVPDAVRRTMASSGRTVVFSACTVAAALSSLLVFQDATMRSLGIAGITVVLACMIAALTLLPALLGRFGHRLGVATKAADEGFFARLARLISRRAGFVVVLVSLVLLLLAAPFLNARFDNLDVRALPKSSETRQVAEAVDQRFPGVTQEPVWAIASVDRDDPAVAELRPRHPGARRRAHRRDQRHLSRRPYRDPGVADGATNGPISERVVSEVRGVDAPFRFQVGGDPAETVDYRHGLEARLPFAIAIVVIATFVLLFLMTGSVVLPFKAIIMNVLSLGATFGALVWIFQDGHLREPARLRPTRRARPDHAGGRVRVRVRAVDGLRGLHARPHQGGLRRDRRQRRRGRDRPPALGQDHHVGRAPHRHRVRRLHRGRDRRDEAARPRPRARRRHRRHHRPLPAGARHDEAHGHVELVGAEAPRAPARPLRPPRNPPAPAPDEGSVEIARDAVSV